MAGGIEVNEETVNIDKTVRFLDFMVKAVFVSTFIFTIVMCIFAWLKDWEDVATVLIEKWFTIMVGEIIVTGFIQIVKEVTQSKIRQIEANLRCEDSGNGDG